VVVTEVQRNAFAARLFRPGDLLEDVNGMPVNTVNDVQRALAAGSPGATQFVINRNGQRVQCALASGRGVNCGAVSPRVAGRGASSSA
jgi:S1-C subfamily serine protease